MTQPKHNRLAAIRLAQQGRKDLDDMQVGLVARYAAAEAAITAVVGRAILSGRLGGLRFRRSQQRQIAELLAKVDALAKPRTRRVLRDAFRLGARVAKRTRLFGEADDPFSRMNRASLDLLIDNLDGRLSAATDTVGRRVDDVFRREGLRMAAVQIADERTLARATREMAERLSREGATSFTDRSGKRWGLERYAEMAIRTVTSEAQFAGTQAVMLGLGFDLVEVNKVREPCAQCKPYDGETFSLTGRAKDHPRLDRVFPIHPRCRHFILPSPLAFEERREAGVL